MSGNNNPYLKNGLNSYKIAGSNDSPLRKGILLYSQVIDNLELAKKAIEEENLDSRLEYVKKAENIITKLRLSLDTESQDSIVIIFDQLYENLIYSLHEIIIYNKPASDLEAIIADLQRIKSEFETIDEQEANLVDLKNSNEIEC
jgi:flagellar biosynthetic protein FliS